MQQGSYPIGSRTINVATDTATGVVTNATCDIPLNALAQAIQTFLNLGTPIAVAYGGTGASTAAGARTNLGLGTMATQNSSSVSISGGSVDGTTVGAGSPSTGAFTTLSASSTVSGTGFSTYLASPPAIGGTSPNTGAFTNLSSSGTVSGTGFSTYLASPPAIGGTSPAAGSFTNLSSSGTVSGTGFSTYLASPPAIGGTSPAAGSFTTLSSSGNAKVISGNAGGQSVATATITVVTTWTTTLNTASAFNSSTGVFTAPVAGQYLVSSTLALSGPTWTAGNVVQVVINKNGSTYKIGTTTLQNAGSIANIVATVTSLVDLALNDTVSIAAFHNGTGSATVSAALGTTGNHLTITRIP